MIFVSMALHSAIDIGRNRQLVTIKILNDGTGTENRGNYTWVIAGRKGQVLKQGRLANWPRKSKTACALLQRVINDAYPKGA